MGPTFLVLASLGLWLISLLCAGPGITEDRNDAAGTITHLGDPVGLQADAHANSRSLVLPQTPVFPPGRHGDARLNMTPFGAPRPPGNLTPPPVFPMNPNRSLLPQASAPPSSVPPAGFGASGGRVGR